MHSTHPSPLRHLRRSLRRPLGALATASISVSILACLAAPAMAQPAGGPPGVTFYADAGFRGQSQRFYNDDPDLRDDAFGQDRASSIRIDRGCQVTLYSDSGFRGRSVTLTYDTSDLSQTPVGNDSVSSMRIACGGGYGGPGGGPGGGYGGPGGQTRGVVAYTGPNFQGRSEVFQSDDPVLANNTVGNDGIVSLTVSPGCQVTVFDDFDYRGASATFDRDVPNLRVSAFGHRGVSSMRVVCGRGGGPGGGPGGPYPPVTQPPGSWSGVILFRDANFRGSNQAFGADNGNLRLTSVGSDTVTSVRVSSGCRAILYADTDFRGRSTVIEVDTPNLSGTAVGNDSVSSIQVQCRGYR